MKKMNSISISVSVLALYGAAFFLGQDALLLKNVVGSLFLIVIMPFTVFSIFPSLTSSWIERFFLCLAGFFSVFTPIYFFLNKDFSFAITTGHTILLSAIILIGTITLSLFRHSTVHSFQLPSLEVVKKSLQAEKVLVFALLAFLGIHALNYHFYGFIPEWDGYADIIRIERGIGTGTVQQSYRGFFDTSVMILSDFSGIDPYHIFSVLFILLQTSTFLAIRFFLGRYRVISPLHSAIPYLIALSVPVLSMEIDMTRPQNVLIILLPIFLVFSYRFLVERHVPSAIIAFIIALSGMNYHEFFVFPLFLSFASIIISAIRFAKQSQDKRDRIIAALLFLSGFLFAILATEYIGFVSGALSTAMKIIADIADTSKWRLWFIDNYSGDGSAETGWAGILGTAKYYGYYLSPALVGIFILIFSSVTRTRGLISDTFVRFLLSFVLIFFSFAEILPRLNHVYLPERFWLLIDICLIFLAIPIIAHFQKTISQNRFLISGIVFLCLVGLGGSLYVAYGKKSLTSPREYRAAIWIRNNTPKNATVITQGANGPMILFFAKRTLVNTDPKYFLAPTLLPEGFEPKEKLSQLQNTHDASVADIHSKVDQYMRNEISFAVFAQGIQEQESRLKNIEKEIDSLKNAVDQPLYIVYSFEKFNTLYASRKWWMDTNAYGADIEKFTLAYPLVYSKDGVLIWKVR